MKKLFLLLNFIVPFHLAVVCQVNESAWDDTTLKKWGSEFNLIQITSSIDGSLQKAWLYKTCKKTPQPLIVSLHTWSGDFNQEDPLSKEVRLRDWNYIHPDFRGSNNNPEACGSALVIADLEDAIHFAIKHCNVDTSNVHIIGVSGGGYAALISYMKLNYPVKSFNAWASISDLHNWYWESKGRNNKYADDIEGVIKIDSVLDWKQLYNRSPMYMNLKLERRKNSTLNIFAGVHDGYTGSVPISHSILFYNRIAADLYPGKTNVQVADTTWMSILIKQLNPNPDTNLILGGRKIHLLKRLPGLSLTLFDGGHEMLVPQALALARVDSNINLNSLNILIIGDSNGAFEFGYPQQLSKLLPYATVINKSISGNTIGFDNLGESRLNTLKNIDEYLSKAFLESANHDRLDYLFIGLGTNDTKAIFRARQTEIVTNLETLLQKINNYLSTNRKIITHICLITPPPMDEKKLDSVKYGGGDQRIQNNNLLFQKIAKKFHIDF